MKTHKFVFVFVDNEDRHTHEICIEVLCDKHDKWKHDDDNKEKYVKWACDHAKFKALLKCEVKKQMIQRFSYHIKMDEYKLYEIDVFNDCKMMNIEGSKDVPLFQEISLMEKVKMVYCKGKHPMPWTKIFDYQVTNHFVFFKIDERSDDDIVLLDVTNKVIDTTKINSTNIVDYGKDASKDTEGGMRERYLEMKKAYLRSKNMI